MVTHISKAISYSPPPPNYWYTKRSFVQLILEDFKEEGEKKSPKGCCCNDEIIYNGNCYNILEMYKITPNRTMPGFADPQPIFFFRNPSCSLVLTRGYFFLSLYLEDLAYHGKRLKDYQYYISICISPTIIIIIHHALHSCIYPFCFFSPIPSHSLFYSPELLLLPRVFFSFLKKKEKPVYNDARRKIKSTN